MAGAKKDFDFFFKSKAKLVLVGIVFLATSCASRILKYEQPVPLDQNKEFERVVKIEISPPPEIPAQAADPAGGQTKEAPLQAKDPSPGGKNAVASIGKKKPLSKRKSKTERTTQDKLADAGKSSESETKPVRRREPELESDIGFNGRRPIKDPFLVGEKVTHRVQYFKMSAGTLAFEVRPFAMVNGRKCYNFRTSVNTSSLFSSFYTASDYFHKILEQSSQNKDYIHSVSVEAKESLIVKADERRTRRFITKKEYARIIGVRTKLIALYAKVFVDVTNIIDPKIMAIKEIKEKKCPLMLKREIGTGKDGRKICELWSVNEMIVPFD
jgi:DNA-directed RNA polymerase subunit K/omega